MNRKSASTRPNVGGFGNSTSAIIALVAVAALMTSMPSLAHMRASAVESRANIIETQSVRELAEAVAAAARELVGADRVLPQIDAAVLARFTTPLGLPNAKAPIDSVDVHELVRRRVIAERMLDLPPPLC